MYLLHCRILLLFLYLDMFAFQVKNVHLESALRYACILAGTYCMPFISCSQNHYHVQCVLNGVTLPPLKLLHNCMDHGASGNVLQAYRAICYSINTTKPHTTQLCSCHGLEIDRLHRCQYCGVDVFGAGTQFLFWPYLYRASDSPSRQAAKFPIRCGQS